MTSRPGAEDLKIFLLDKLWYEASTTFSSKEFEILYAYFPESLRKSELRAIGTDIEVVKPLDMPVAPDPLVVLHDVAAKCSTR